MRKLALVTVVIVALASACGGSSSKSGSGTNSGSSNASSSSGNNDFQQLLDQMSTRRVKVTYTQTESDGSTNTFTLAQDGKGLISYTTKDSQIIKNGDTVTICDGLPDNISCRTLTGPDATAALSPFTAILAAARTYVDQAVTSHGIGDTSSDTIAGRDAQCVTITIGSALGKVGNAIAKGLGKDTGAGWKSCADKQTGVLLLWEPVGADSANQGKIEATAFGEPSDADFTPPSTTPGTSGGSTATTTGSGSDTTVTTAAAGGSTSGSTACPGLPALPSGVTYPAGVPCAANG